MLQSDELDYRSKKALQKGGISELVCILDELVGSVNWKDLDQMSWNQAGWVTYEVDDNRAGWDNLKTYKESDTMW